VAIDPHGVVGDPGYQTGALLYNPWPERREAELLAVVPARNEQLAAGLTMAARAGRRVGLRHGCAQRGLDLPERDDAGQPGP
jgi:streptomycin 6-kinase